MALHAAKLVCTLFISKVLSLHWPIGIPEERHLIDNIVFLGGEASEKYSQTGD